MIISKDIGIVIFGYNRPSHLMRILIALEDYKIKKIHFFLDGPKNLKDKIVQKQILFMVKQSKNIEITIHKSKKNLGIAKSITSGMDKMSKKYKKIIVIEDDCIPRREFFHFFGKMLKKKSLFEKIGAICAYQFPNIHKKNNYTLHPVELDFFIPWGWATTSAHWTEYRKKKNNLKNLSIKSKFPKIIKRLNKLVKNNEKNIWSLNFIIYNFLQGKKFIFPDKSLIKNIGFDGTGVNSKNTNVFETFYTPSKKIYDNIIYDNKLRKRQEQILNKHLKYFY